MIAMTEPEGCGNAPRHLVIRKIVLAFAEVNAPQLNRQLADKVNWEIPGGEAIEGVAGVTDRLCGQAEVDHIELSSILTHGREGGVDGVITFRNGTKQAFCHVMRFASAQKPQGHHNQELPDQSVGPRATQ